MGDEHTPGPAVECQGCGAITPVSADELQGAVASPCPACEEEGMLDKVELVKCEKGSGCGHDDHHFGIKMHVVSVQ